jgi:hypothetical protein
MTKGDVGGGRSNRAKRARMANQLFAAHAGLQKIEGAEEDQFGNALHGDLGEDGAFDGLVIVILQLYTGFSMDNPVKALQTKVQEWRKM